MNCVKLLIVLSLFYANFIASAYSANKLIEYENNLEDAVKNHTISLVKQLIDKKYAKTSIVDKINTSLRQKFGGWWKSLVYETTKIEFGAAFLVESKQMRFAYGSKMVLVFKLDDYACEIENREHLIDRVNIARSSDISLDIYKGLEKTEATKVANTIVGEFLANTIEIQYKPCAKSLYNYDPTLNTTIYNSNSCFYAITKQIVTKIKAIDTGADTFNFVYSKARLTIGESFYYSSRESRVSDRSKLKKNGRKVDNDFPDKTLGFWLGPLYFLMYF